VGERRIRIWTVSLGLIALVTAGGALAASLGGLLEDWRAYRLRPVLPAGGDGRARIAADPGKAPPVIAALLGGPVTGHLEGTLGETLLSVSAILGLPVVLDPRVAVMAEADVDIGSYEAGSPLVLLEHVLAEAGEPALEYSIGRDGILVLPAGDPGRIRLESLDLEGILDRDHEVRFLFWSRTLRLDPATLRALIETRLGAAGTREGAVELHVDRENLRLRVVAGERLQWKVRSIIERLRRSGEAVTIPSSG